MLSGSVSTSKYKHSTGTYWWAVLNWTAIQDKIKNETTINWEVLADNDAAAGAVRYSELRVVIDGTEEYYVSASNNITGSKGTVLASGSKVVSHNLDGSKKITISLEAGVYVHAINCTGSESFELDQIPRASTIAATDANVGSTCMIAVNKKSDSYTHSIKYTFGSLSGYVTTDGGTSSSEVKISQASIGFTVPTAFYDQMGSDKTKDCMLTCTTYSGSTKIGDVTTATFAVTVTDASAPTVSGTIKDINPVSKSLTGNENILIRFVSTARCTITAEAKDSATISEKKINGEVVTGATLDIQNVEFGTIPFYAKDSRGYETTVEVVAADIVPYVILTCNPRIVRTDQAAGKAMIYINGNFYDGTFGFEPNNLTMMVTYKTGDTDNFVYVDPVIGENGEYTVEQEISGLDYEKNYTFTVTVSDNVSTIVKTVPVGRGIPVFDWGQSDFYFNVPVFVQDCRLYAGQVLYTGNGSGDITLDDDATNYEYLDIHFTDNAGNGDGFARVHNPNGKTIHLSLIESGSAFHSMYIRHTNYAISGNTLTPQTNTAGYLLFQNGTWDYSTSGSNYLRVTRVVGYK